MLEGSFEYWIMVTRRKGQIERTAGVSEIVTGGADNLPGWKDGHPRGRITSPARTINGQTGMVAGRRRARRLKW
jgi:hypothetical protein